METSSTCVVEAAGRLLDEFAASAPPLGAVASRLDELALALEVDRVIVAVDDAHLGRQVFSSGRKPLGETGLGLFGPPRICTEPPLAIEDAAAALLVSVVREGLSRSQVVARAVVAPPTGAGPLLDSVSAAAARATRYGWGFSLVLARFDRPSSGRRERLVERLRGGLRAGDALVEVSPDEVALVMHAANDGVVATVLTRVARAVGLPPFSFGLVTCPSDGSDARVLVALATERLREATRANR